MTSPFTQVPWLGPMQMSRSVVRRSMISLLVFGCLGTAGASAPQAGRVAAPVRGTTASSIDERKAHLPSIQRVSDEYSLEGTTVTAWGTPQNIEKVEVSALHESGRSFLDFYWRDSTLIAARQRRLYYDKPLTTEEPMHLIPGGVDYLEFDDGKLKRWSEDSKTQPVTGAAAEEKTAELTNLAKSFHRLMTSPGPVNSQCEWKCQGSWSSQCRTFQCVPW